YSFFESHAVTSTLYAYTTLFRSAPVAQRHRNEVEGEHHVPQGHHRPSQGPRFEVGYRHLHRLHVCARGVQHGHALQPASHAQAQDRKSTRLNSSHVKISYAVFSL